MGWGFGTSDTQGVSLYELLMYLDLLKMYFCYICVFVYLIEDRQKTKESGKLEMEAWVGYKKGKRCKEVEKYVRVQVVY